MDISTLLPYIISAVTGFLGWLFGKKQQDNKFLQDLQESINALASSNKELMSEILLVKKQNVDLEINQQKLEKQNCELKRQIEDLNLQLEKLLDENRTLKKQKNEKVCIPSPSAYSNIVSMQSTETTAKPIKKTSRTRKG